MLSDLAYETRLAVTLFWFGLHYFSHVNCVVLMLTTQHLHEKDEEVCIKTSLSLKGQVNEQQLENWLLSYHSVAVPSHCKYCTCTSASCSAGHCSMAFPPHKIIPLTHCSSTPHHTTWPLFITFSPHYMYIVPLNHCSTTLHYTVSLSNCSTTLYCSTW